MGVDPDEDEYASDDEPMAQARRGISPAKQGEDNHGKFMENTMGKPEENGGLMGFNGI